jgi:hypothetical protein
VVAAAELGLEVAPDAVEGAGGGARLLDVVDAVLVEDLFEVAAEACALEGFGQEVALESFILEMFADVGEALLAVEKNADDEN